MSKRKTNITSTPLIYSSTKYSCCAPCAEVSGLLCVCVNDCHVQNLSPVRRQKVQTLINVDGLQSATPPERRELNLPPAPWIGAHGGSWTITYMSEKV